VYQAIPPKDARPRAEEAIARAAALKPDLAAIPYLRAQLKLYLRPDWPSARDDLTESLRRDPNDALANVYMAYVEGLLGERTERSRWAAKAVASDPLSPFVRGIAGMSHYVSRDYEEALRLYDEGLALDSNFVLCLWQSAMALDRLGRLDEALVRIRRAVDLSRRGVMMVSFEYQELMRLGRVEEARAAMASIDARRSTEYVGELVAFYPPIFSGDEDEMAAALQFNIAAGTGPTTIACSVDVELEALLPHPRLGPLVRQLSLFAGREL
jgi:tetratricopeptide (TPR) repeat protein